MHKAKITVNVWVEFQDGLSENNVIDAVSLQLWDLDNDSDFVVKGLTVTSYELGGAQ